MFGNDKFIIGRLFLYVRHTVSLMHLLSV